MNNKRGSKKFDAPPHEFSELIANLLVSCIQGLTKALPAKDKLSKKLKDLEGGEKGSPNQPCYRAG